MSILATIFSLSLLFGQIVRIPIYQGVTIYPHDILLSIYVILWIVKKSKRRHTQMRLCLQKPLFFFLSAICLSLVVNMFHHSQTDVINGIFYVLRFVLYLSLYVIVSQSKEKAAWLNRLYG
ncbi:hypothetical protein MUP56_01615, partial [Patescibacteria group bacterium]|nr:hypothetical protein [Patescibacteria group bacterium]